MEHPGYFSLRHLNASFSDNFEIDFFFFIESLIKRHVFLSISNLGTGNCVN